MKTNSILIWMKKKKLQVVIRELVVREVTRRELRR
jgi:hypothetical protein